MFMLTIHYVLNKIVLKKIIDTLKQLLISRDGSAFKRQFAIPSYRDLKWSDLSKAFRFIQFLRKLDSLIVCENVGVEGRWERWENSLRRIRPKGV
ncbi:hypothetical protein [Desulfosporosinus acididurans]|uniref:hypothetical protein n=1 Tax=Desulfosporosinus acididurans TaxID=476652 RepID=UPI000649C442|nr:hypothetical protein [Desulfosporosinus acididurans]